MIRISSPNKINMLLSLKNVVTLEKLLCCLYLCQVIDFFFYSFTVLAMLDFDIAFTKM